MIESHCHPNNLWFKVLSVNDKPIDGSSENWPLPSGRLHGDIQHFAIQPSLIFFNGKWKNIPDIYGTWLTRNPKNLYPYNSGRRIYVAQILSEPTYQIGDMIYTHKVRLIREATNLDLKRFGIHRAFRQVL